MSASKSRGTATIASHRSTAPANLLSSAASELERHRGAPKLRAAAALFSLGSKGRYVAAKSGGNVTAKAGSTNSDSPHVTCWLAPQHYYFCSEGEDSTQ